MQFRLIKCEVICLKQKSARDILRSSFLGRLNAVSFQLNIIYARMLPKLPFGAAVFAIIVENYL